MKEIKKNMFMSVSYLYNGILMIVMIIVNRLIKF